MLPEYATVEDVADTLKIHPESVRRLIRRGDIRAIKFGNTWAISRRWLRLYAGEYDPAPGRPRKE